MVCCVGFCRTPAALPPRAWTTCLCSIEVRENAAFWLFWLVSAHRTWRPRNAMRVGSRVGWRCLDSCGSAVEARRSVVQLSFA